MSKAFSRTFFNFQAKIATPTPPPQIIDLSFAAGDPLDILACTPIELAEQLTYVDSKLFCAIHPCEYILNKDGPMNFTLEYKRRHSPNLTKLQEHHAYISGWVAQVLCTCEDSDKRSQIYLQFVRIMNCLIQLQNYLGLVAIYGGIERQAVYRMTSTRDRAKLLIGEEVDQGKLAYTKEDLADLIDHTNNFSALKSRKDSPPYIPYVPMYVSELSFCQELGHIGGWGLAPGMINWRRQTSITALVQQIDAHRKASEYADLIPKPEILGGIFGFHLGSEDDLYSASFFVEPMREQPPKPNFFYECWAKQSLFKS